MKQIFPGIYQMQKGKRKLLVTKNLTPGKTVYIEKLFKEGNVEYREWIPNRSKLASAIIKGITKTGIDENSTVLYLGCASGTTVSHISDIVAKGFVFAIDFAPRVMRQMVYVAEDRPNIAPILADASKPAEYAEKIGKVDFLFQDIAQRNQVEIFLKNTFKFLKKGGIAMLAVKARSIDVTKKPKEIFQEVKRDLKSKLEIIDYRILHPFQRDHCFFVCKRR